MCDRYSRRTCAINAMLGTSTTPRSPGPDNSDMIRIDTRVLPVPHGSTSVARAASHGIQSAGLLPSQRSRCSGNPVRSACTHAATASCCMAVRGSGSVAACSVHPPARRPAPPRSRRRLPPRRPRRPRSPCSGALPPRTSAPRTPTPAQRRRTAEPASSSPTRAAPRLALNRDA